MLRVCSLLVLMMWGSVAVAASPNTISGQARVIDGDTLDVGGTRVRLHGIDAVEADQTCRHPERGDWACGAHVSRELRNWVEGRAVRCAAHGTDRYGRRIASCDLDGQDLGQALVRAGLAFAYKKYSTRYVVEERAALRDGRGLWTSVVLQPEAFRAAKAPAPQVAPKGCAIKGNVSADGKRIYHVPGQVFYARTRVNTAKGERWFCSEYAARMAGWRRAQR